MVASTIICKPKAARRPNPLAFINSDRGFFTARDIDLLTMIWQAYACQLLFQEQIVTQMQIIIIKKNDFALNNSKVINNMN